MVHCVCPHCSPIPLCTLCLHHPFSTPALHEFSLCTTYILHLNAVCTPGDEAIMKIHKLFFGI